MGVIQVELLRGKEIFSFEYHTDWIKKGPRHLLDPDLEFYSGKQFLSDEKPNFGMFLDSSPDRWGRVLMRRREAAIARSENRASKTLLESDYLLGVYDQHRMGGIRFKLDPAGQFLNDDKSMSTPPWSSIGELERISLRIEEDDAIDDPDYLRWLHVLMAPGSSLGGARPKASVMGREKKLWIAKFPSKEDIFDVGGWEMVTHALAIKAGIIVPDANVRKFNSRHHTFLSRRFDRTAQGERIHFASAMTLLGHIDGQGHEEGVSYLDLVDFITSQGANVKKDLRQLWRRIVFSIFVSNTDDHLRNHGFLLSPDGWALSPAYDINPIETATGLSLNISMNDNALDLDLAMEVHEYFRLDKDEAGQIIQEVRSAVQSWRSVASHFGISRSEQDLKAPAFRLTGI